MKSSRYGFMVLIFGSDKIILHFLGQREENKRTIIRNLLHPRILRLFIFGQVHLSEDLVVG